MPEDKKLAKSDVEHVAQLARIDLRDAEKEKYTKELSQILNYVEELDKAPTENIESIEQISNLENIVRDDKIAESLSNEEALKNAPDKENGFIKTKKVFE